MMFGSLGLRNEAGKSCMKASGFQKQFLVGAVSCIL